MGIHGTQGRYVERGRHDGRRVMGAVATLVGIAAVAVACSSSSDTVAAGGAGGSGAAAGQSSTAPAQAAVSAPTSAPPGSLPMMTPMSTNPPAAPDPALAQDGPTAVPRNGPPTTYPDPNTSLPDGSVSWPTIPASGQDPAMLDCGTLHRAAGWPTTFVMSPTYFQCLGDAFAAGTPARLVDRQQTDGFGGAILVTTYDVLGPGRLRVTEDATQAADRPQVVTVSTCTGLMADSGSVVPTGCSVSG